MDTFYNFLRLGQFQPNQLTTDDKFRRNCKHNKNFQQDKLLFGHGRCHLMNNFRHQKQHSKIYPPRDITWKHRPTLVILMTSRQLLITNFG